MLLPVTCYCVYVTSGDRLYCICTDGDIVAVTDLHTDPESHYVLSVEIGDKYNPKAETKELIIELLGKQTRVSESTLYFA